MKTAMGFVAAMMTSLLVPVEAWRKKEPPFKGSACGEAWCDHHELPLAEAKFLLEGPGSRVLTPEDRDCVLWSTGGGKAGGPKLFFPNLSHWPRRAHSPIATQSIVSSGWVTMMMFQVLDFGWVLVVARIGVEFPAQYPEAVEACCSIWQRPRDIVTFYTDFKGVFLGGFKVFRGIEGRTCNISEDGWRGGRNFRSHGDRGCDEYMLECAVAGGLCCCSMSWSSAMSSLQRGACFHGWLS